MSAGQIRDNHHPGVHAERVERGRETRRVTVVSAVVNLALSLAQVLIGLAANSAALVADGIHSASDLLSDILVWFASRHASMAPDQDHPYGHGRFETAATLGLGILLILVALGIVWNGLERLLDMDRPVPGQLAVFVAAIGIVAKESLYWYTIAVARRLRSDMLRANAWHHRSDAISSIVVLIGVGGAVIGYGYMDALAAIVVGALVAKIGWDLGWGALTELVDTALEQEQVGEAKRVIMAIDGVRSVHMLRTRRHGAEASADVHVQVAPRLSVSEGHMISQAVEDRMIEKVGAITDVTVHIDPEDDEDAPTCRGLPLRAQVLSALDAAWQGAQLAQPHDTRLHYLGGKIDVELILPLASYADAETASRLQAQLEEAARNLPWFRRLRVLYG
ncbi:MAG: cation diffusion facilitator family transporter [Chromatiaceae bacterium]|jgi:cation diffusion facilitator family transporter|nr:cation diffusion facilitator family transporter [Chromatiaceae bacterium]